MSTISGGETKANISGWTVDTLHAHIQTIINDRDKLWLTILDEREKRHEQRFIAAQKAVDVAQADAEKWRDNANEWRAAMNDKDKTYATKEYVDAKFKSIKENLVAIIIVLAAVFGALIKIWH